MDDILDYVATEEEFGKSIGHDLEEGKITLPLIHTLRHCSDSERAVIAAVVEQDEMSLDDFRAVSGFVKQYGGIDYTVESCPLLHKPLQESSGSVCAITRSRGSAQPVGICSNAQQISLLRAVLFPHLISFFTGGFMQRILFCLIMCLFLL